ncbi:MAG: penicillin-binding protein 2 [Firmicutes bacterium]|nr:penicillin-binding protein 2 [Bacillota bacterium]
MKRKIANKKSLILVVIIGLIFVTLAGRLAFLQLVQTQRYQGLAQNNLIRIIPITAPRGEIRDRNGELLVDNQPVYTLSLSFLGVSEQKQRQVEKLVANILARDKNVGRDVSWWTNEIKKSLEKQARPFEPVKVAIDVSWETVVQVRERQMELPGVIVEEEPIRNYPQGELLTHVLGYVREIKEEQLKAREQEGYRMGDLYGQAGLENAFESYLRGEKGARQIEVDAYGRPVDYRGVKEPVPGDNLTLTIDYRLQKAAEEALVSGIERAQKNGFEEANGGAVVVLDVRTGAVLAMASYPSYDPSVFVDMLSVEEWEEMQQTRALSNRALGSYAPGSIFKMVTATAILENDVVDPTYSIPDPGYYFLGRRYNDWKPDGHGRVNLRKAIKVSCNTYFFKYGRAVGQRAIAHYAHEYGLGEKTGIELPGEQAGVVPTPEYKYNTSKAVLMRYNKEFQKVTNKYEQLIAQAKKMHNDEKVQRLKKERDKEIESLLDAYSFDLEWQAFDTLNMSIGQGYNWYTPLQMANYVATIANGGELLQPYIVKQITDPDGESKKSFGPQVRRQVNVSPETIEIVQEGMRMVTEPGGTAHWSFRDFPLTVAAKTGSAEVLNHDTHSQFVTYTPYEKPEIAVAAVVEYGGHGSDSAGPITREIMDAYVKITRGEEFGKPKQREVNNAGTVEREPSPPQENAVEQETTIPNSQAQQVQAGTDENTPQIEDEPPADSSSQPPTANNPPSDGLVNEEETLQQEDQQPEEQ